MPNNITIFKDPDGERYYNVVIDGRIVDGLATDETLATVACALLGGTMPPYAKGRTLQELREQEREAGEQATLRKEAAGMRERVVQAMIASGWIEARGTYLYDTDTNNEVNESVDLLVQHLTTNQGDTR
jgi:hypothetical protein